MARSTFKVLFYVNGNKENGGCHYPVFSENALGREREQGERQECGST